MKLSVRRLANDTSSSTGCVRYDNYVGIKHVNKRARRRLDIAKIRYVQTYLIYTETLGKFRFVLILNYREHNVKGFRELRILVK